MILLLVHVVKGRQLESMFDQFLLEYYYCYQCDNIQTGVNSSLDPVIEEFHYIIE